MWKPKALANSLAVLTIVMYVALYVLHMISASWTDKLVNVQFMGYDVASHISFSLAHLAKMAIGGTVTAWVGGYVWGWLYNKLA